MLPSILAENGFAALSGVVSFLVVIIAVAGAFFWVWMVMDVLKYEPPGTERVAWGLAVFFTGFIGAVLYYFMKHRPRVTGARNLTPTR